MKTSKGTKHKKLNHKDKVSIIDIDFENGYKIYVFPGELSKNDIRIMYSEEGKRIRTPKHIHWTVDLLLKMQKENSLTKDFIKKLKDEWNKSKPLSVNNEQTLITLVDDCIVLTDISKYEKLNYYGEYDIEFLTVLMTLLMTQEKTNNKDAYMFGRILDALLEDDLDIFSIMMTAGFGGHRG